MMEIRVLPIIVRTENVSTSPLFVTTITLARMMCAGMAFVNLIRFVCLMMAMPARMITASAGHVFMSQKTVMTATSALPMRV